MSLFVPKDRRSLFRQFLGGMYDAVVITDPNGHILDINPRATEHFGYELDDVLDQPISRLIPGLQPEVVQRIRKGLEGDRHVMINANGLNQTGGKFACEVTVSVIDLMNPGDLVFTIRNIEKRRATMTSCQTKVNAFNLAKEALFACDAEGRLTEANDAFLARFSLADESALRAKTIFALLGDDTFKGALARAVSGERVSTTTSDGRLSLTLAPNGIGRKTVGVVGALEG